MQSYRHTQRGTLSIWALGAAIALAAAITVAVAIDGAPAVLIPAIVLAVLVPVFVLLRSLTVEVTPQRLAIRFGPGWIRKEYPIREITRARAVRNHWYYGWGIRWTPHGWLYNVSGLDAVEILLAGGRKVRIGTDEPAELEAAIRRAIAAGG